MKQKTLKIKGMGVPRLIIWAQGFFHGRIIKTAGIDEETGYICSGYVTGKSKLFNELSSNRVKQLELELKAVRAEAFDLMAQDAQIRKNLEKDTAGDSPSTINEKRNAERCASRRASYSKRHEEIVQRLGEIDSKIRSCELNAREELDATASALQSIFSTYAHGMLLRPIQSKFIPPVEYKHCFDLYRESHKDEDQQIRYMLKEVYDYE